MKNEFNVKIPSYYEGYVKNLERNDFMEILRNNYQSTPGMLLRLPPEKWNFSYAPGKWSVKEVLLHLIDCERIFSYRALRFARNDKTELAGFDENEYIPNCNASQRNDVSIIDEYKSVRNATISLFMNFNEETLLRTGFANGSEFSVLLTGAIIAGHELHHLNVLKERYDIGK